MWADHQLWRSIQEQADHAAFRVLYQRYWQQLYAMAYRRLGGQEAARDMVQDIFVSIWNNRQQISVEESLWPYLLRALKYQVINFYVRRPQPVQFEMPSPAPVPAPSQLVEYKEMLRFIELELQAMPGNVRESWVLNQQGGMSIAAIASHLSLSEQTVRNNITIARKRLRAVILRYGDETLVCLYFAGLLAAHQA